MRRAREAPTGRHGRPLRLNAMGWLLIGAGAFYTLFILRTAFRAGGQVYFTLVDDAMVSMRYARHLAEGYGPVWNLGAAPVQGFTNPLWTLVMAGFHVLGIPLPKVSLGVMVAAGVCLLLNALVVHALTRRLHPEGRLAPLIAAVVTSFYFPLVFWSLRGMEVGVLCLLVDAAVFLAVDLGNRSQIRKCIALGVLLGLALAVRMDALLQAGVLLAYVFTYKPENRRNSLLAGLIVLAFLGTVLLFQQAYFGDLLPNTYYQKLAQTSVLERLQNGVLVFIEYATRDTLALALIGIAGAVLYKLMRSPEVALLAALFVVQCAYSIWVGGDYAEPEVDAANRFITQGMPALIVVFSLAVDHIMSSIAASQKRKAFFGREALSACLVGLGALALISGKPWAMWAIDNAPLFKADVRRVKIGLAIAEHTQPTAVIAVHAAGQIPYYSERTTIDLLGLNDPVIAHGPLAGPFYPGHDKWNYDYSIGELKPDLIADNWTRLGDYMRGAADYLQLESGMYVRKDSTLVDAAALSQP